MNDIKLEDEKLERYFKGEFTEKDASYAAEVFLDNQKEKELKNLLLRQFNDLPEDDSEDQKVFDRILHRIHYNINTRNAEQNNSTSHKILIWTLRIAGVILLPLIVFFGIQKFNNSGSGKQAWIEINSPAWTRVQFSLPDGTTGWLNSSSSIKYNANFIKDRQVTLRGEAFFNVYKDKHSPFIVTAKEVNVKVLGTRFNIASYDNEQDVEVVLEEGSLLFTETEKNKSYTMFPNDLIKYDKKNKDFTKNIVEPHKYLSWTEGKLVFRNDPLDVVARRLERWYNIDVDVKTNLSDDLRLRATFKDESLEEVLGLLKRSLPLDFKIEERDINTDGTYGRKKVILTARTK
jgi:ferric-dicitrate binding protein FerR (iron transport regulator)